MFYLTTHFIYGYMALDICVNNLYYCGSHNDEPTDIINTRATLITGFRLVFGFFKDCDLGL